MEREATLVHLMEPSGIAKLLFVAPIPISIVIFSGSGLAKKFVSAGIDKREEIPSTIIFIAALVAAILSSISQDSSVVKTEEKLGSQKGESRTSNERGKVS